MAADNHYDAIIIGAGFGGIYMAYKLANQGLKIKVLDAAPEVGGTWYWNRYPGAMSDTESYIYRFSWDKEDLQTYKWDEHYVKQPQALAYLKHVVDKHDLRKYIQLNTEMLGAVYHEDRNVWAIRTKDAEFTCHYFVTALGLLSRQNWPDIPGRNLFRGEVYHTGNWPAEYDFTGKKVGVIGNGSTGVQVITQLGKENKIDKLYCFQRTPQYSVPSGDGPVSKEYRDKINANYDQIWNQVKNSAVCFGFEESTVPCMSVSPEERQRVFQEAWDKGNGFRFMFATFGDLTFNEAANEEACEFIRTKIREIVKDPEKARKLCPTDMYARRPLCDGGYYEQFNNPKVEIVSLKEEPIESITEKGLKTANGEYELDMLIFGECGCLRKTFANRTATGFDAVDGNYTRLRIQGRGGQSLKEHWAESGPESYFGVSVAGFPNQFFICGPNGPFTNIPPTIETHVEFISDTIALAEKHNPKKDAVVEATSEAEKGWTDVCNKMSEASLFKKVSSWIFGANIPSKKRSSLFFFGGLKDYRQRLQAMIDGGYTGYKPFL